MDSSGIKMADAISNINRIGEIKEYFVYPSVTAGVYPYDTVYIKIADIDLSIKDTIVFIRWSGYASSGSVGNTINNISLEAKVILQRTISNKLCSTGIYNNVLFITYDNATQLYSVFIKNTERMTNRYISVGWYNPVKNNPIVKVYSPDGLPDSELSLYVKDQEYIDEHLAVSSFYEGTAADSQNPINICTDKNFSIVPYQKNILAVYGKACVEYFTVPASTNWTELKDTNNNPAFDATYGANLISKKYVVPYDLSKSHYCFSGDDTAFSNIKNGAGPGFEFFNTTLGEELIKYPNNIWRSKVDGTEYSKIVRNGITTNRPTDVKVGFQFFDETLGKPIWHKRSNIWVEGDGAKAGVRRSGTFANKPEAADIYVGFKYFCTDKQTTEGATDGIEIIHKGSDVWVDALGRVVE